MPQNIANAMNFVKTDTQFTDQMLHENGKGDD